MTPPQKQGTTFREISLQNLHMDVSKNRDTPKWIVYNGKPY